MTGFIWLVPCIAPKQPSTTRHLHGLRGATDPPMPRWTAWDWEEENRTAGGEMLVLGR